jgi:hypothetical protein
VIVCWEEGCLEVLIVSAKIDGADNKNIRDKIINNNFLFIHHPSLSLIIFIMLFLFQMGEK